MAKVSLNPQFFSFRNNIEILYFYRFFFPPGGDEDTVDADLEDLLDDENMSCTNPVCHSVIERIEESLNERDGLLKMVNAMTGQVNKAEENVVEAEQNRKMLEERAEWMKDEIKRFREDEVTKKRESERIVRENAQLRDKIEQYLRLKQKYSSQVNGLFRKINDPYAEPRPIEVVFSKHPSRPLRRDDDDESTLRGTRATGLNELLGRPQSASGKTKLLDWNILEDCLRREVVIPPARPRSAASILGRTQSGKMRFPAPASMDQPMSESRSFAVIPGETQKNRSNATGALQRSKSGFNRPKSAGAVLQNQRSKFSSAKRRPSGNDRPVSAHGMSSRNRNSRSFSKHHTGEQQQKQARQRPKSAGAKSPNRRYH